MSFEDERPNALTALKTFCIQKINALFHDSWKWTFEQHQMLRFKWLKFSPGSMGTFSFHQVVINFKLTVYCCKGLKKGTCCLLGWGMCWLLVCRSCLLLALGKSEHPLCKARSFWGLEKLLQVSRKDILFMTTSKFIAFGLWWWKYLVLQVTGYKKIAPIKLFKVLLNMLKILPCRSMCGI